MKNFLSKTLGGLSLSYYFRNLFFALIIFAIATWSAINADIPQKELNIAIFAVLTLLYPYSRFVYESIVGFIVGNNQFYVAGALLILSLCWKLMSIILCWGFSIFIAPFGLIYLYFYHSKNEVNDEK